MQPTPSSETQSKDATANKLSSDRDASDPRRSSRLHSLLRRLMPPRAGIKALIDRRHGQADPWLDEKYDVEPER